MCASGEGDFTLQLEPSTSIQHTAKRKKKHKHKSKRDSERHAFFPLINLWLMSIFYTERLTEVEGAEMEDSPANEWLQGSRFISLSPETLVLLTTVHECLQQIFLRSVNSMVFLRMVKKYVFICCKCEECLYMSEICVHQVKVISHCNWSPPPASSTQQTGTRSTSTKEMVSFMHFLYSHHFLAIVCAYFNTHKPRSR